jgi:quercetin dioxygenase-like cupin family protein
MRVTKLGDLETREVVPGFKAKFVHSDQLTIAHWEIREGASLPEHSHHHEQTVNIMDGRFNLIVDGNLHELESGTAVVIPPNVPHSGKAVTDCRIIDVFFPVREDYR